MEGRARYVVGVPLRENRPLQGMIVGYLGFWLAMALAPLDRSTWLLENLLVFALWGLFLATQRRFVLSYVSHAAIIAFLVLHCVGSHYTYSEVPIGGWFRDVFGLSRNHFDRVVHFAFGLLLAYPVRELVLRRMHVHGRWSYALPALVIAAGSAAYEIIEWAAAGIANEDTGIAYVGAQGDIWDGQKDMLLAVLGGVTGMGMTALYRLATRHEPYLGWPR
jgi:putative membrane protein